MNKTKDLQCISREGCNNRELCEASGHCVRPVDTPPSSKPKSNETAERYAFEAWLVERDICTAQEAVNARAGSSYIHARLDDAWRGWLARSRLPAETTEHVAIDTQSLKNFLTKVADLGCGTVSADSECLACTAAMFLRNMPDTAPESRKHD